VTPLQHWVRIELSVLPLGTTWVPRRALGQIRAVRTRLVIDRTRLTATLLRDGRAVFRAPVGVGRTRSPTPRGKFTIRQRLDGFGDPFYGPIAFGSSARSPVLTDWPAGGFVGVHGTNSPELIPGRVSHGCIRMRNADIRAPRDPDAARDAAHRPLTGAAQRVSVLLRRRRRPIARDTPRARRKSLLEAIRAPCG
jgi:L,D-transpeptidase catalytic domain